MIIKQLMPGLSPTMEEGSIVSWSIAVGDQVDSGQVMAEIQTDKAVVEWECLDGGHCREILIPAGASAKVNMVAAIFSSSPDEDISAALTEAKATNEELAAAAPEKKAEPAAQAETPAPEQPTAPTPGAPAPVSAPASRDELPAGARISPVAARLAAARGVPLGKLVGSGPGGRIVRKDVEAWLQKPSGAQSDGNPFLIADGPAFRDIPMTPMRRVIAERLGQSKHQIPHFYVTEKVNCRELITLREQLNSIDGVKISFNDLIIKAAALTLRRHPGVNATFDGDTVRQWSSADISIAVSIPDGLITPIVARAHQLTISEIGASVRDLASRARSGRLQPQEYQGGTFTITNLGMYGIEAFDAIINPPQVAILAVGGIKDVPVVDKGALVPGKGMRLTLSCDHRVVDGALAAEFMRSLCGILQAPASLML